MTARTTENRRTTTPNCYRFTIRHGYNDEVVTTDLGMLVFEQIRNFVIRDGLRSTQEAHIIVHEESPEGSAEGPSEDKGVTGAQVETEYIAGKKRMIDPGVEQLEVSK